MNMLSPGEPQPFKLRIDDYELLDRAGTFAAQRVELIEGVVIAVNSERLPHTRTKGELMFRLRLALREATSPYDAYVEPSLSLPPHNMPNPDVLVAVSAASGPYFGLLDTAIVMEVAATTLRSDLTVKKHIYAEHGVPEYWVVDVTRHEVHQFWSPSGSIYRESLILPLAGELRSATLPDIAIDGSGIL